MLFVFYGGTGHVGRNSRLYFESKGFEIVRKINYLPNGHVLKTRYEPRKLAKLEEVRACDFVYEYPDGIVMGFNQAQIIDAVWGRKNCFISFSTVDMEFIKQIKASYSDFVTVIGVYIEERALEKTFKSMENMTEKELELRMHIGKRIKENLSNERDLFDEIVIYDGENGFFDMNSLYNQFDSVIKKSILKERTFRDKNYVPLPYTGAEPYVFVSYSHKDAKLIHPILSNLQLERCRLWFDGGLKPGDNWKKIIASKIESPECKDFILFISENSVNSDFVKAELWVAFELGLKIIPIRLDGAKFSTDIAMYLNKFQYIDFDENTVSAVVKAVDPSVRIY